MQFIIIRINTVYLWNGTVVIFKQNDEILFMFKSERVRPHHTKDTEERAGFLLKPWNICKALIHSI